MLSIGEFSRVTHISIKALRLYHEKGILVPSAVNLRSKYRYYDRQAVERARIIRNLQELGFSLQEIKEIVTGCRDDREISARVYRKLDEVNRTVRKYKGIRDGLLQFLDSLTEEKMSDQVHIEMEELPDLWICCIRFQGRYDEVGSKIGALFKAGGRRAAGSPPFSLYYDGEYKEEGADIEVCLEVKKEVKGRNISCRELKGGKAVTLLHHGPYEDLGHSYQRLFEYCRERNLEISMPLREQYLKGPGLIFRGNPEKYVTKLMAMIAG